MKKGFIQPIKFIQGMVIGVMVSFIICLIFDETFVFNLLVFEKMVVGGIIGASIRTLLQP